jgi:uncharacterized membrane protein YuzA (DUF378 family)
MKIRNLLKVLGIIILGFLSLIIILYYENMYNIDKRIVYCLITITGLICGWNLENIFTKKKKKEFNNVV